MPATWSPAGWSSTCSAALGNEQSTNTYGLTVRHAWFSWNRWLVGQTWTNASEIGALVDGVDIVGATDAQVFVRQPQVRYTNGPWSFSLENPETTIAPAGGGARIASDDNNLPDLTARYTHRAPWGFLSGALLLRQLAYETTGTNAVDDTAVAVAGNLSGRVQLGAADDLRFSLTGGEAIGRYIGLGVASDAELDRDGTLEGVSGVAGFVGWRHVFSPQWRANLYAAASRYDHDPAVVGGALTESVRSVSANVFWTPLPKLDLGAELRFARRELESGADGDLRRLHEKPAAHAPLPPGHGLAAPHQRGARSTVGALRAARPGAGKIEKHRGARAAPTMHRPRRRASARRPLVCRSAACSATGLPQARKARGARAAPTTHPAPRCRAAGRDG